MNYFVIKLARQYEDQSVTIGYKTTGGWTYPSNYFTSDEISITDGLVSDGFKFTALYADNNQRAGNEARHVTGLDLQIEFGTKQEFDINNKELWLTSQYTITYNAEADKWVVNGEDPGKGVTQKDITIDAKVFAAMRESGMDYFIIKFFNQYSDQHTIFGILLPGEGNYTAYPENGLTTAKIAITDEMVENGFKFRALYADQNQRVNIEATHVTGFDLTITFDKEVVFDISDKSTWLDTGFTAEYSEDTDKWTMSGDFGQIKLNLRASLIAAMAEEGYTTVKIVFSTDKKEVPTFSCSGDITVSAANRSLTIGAAEITEDMNANGLNLVIKYSDGCSQGWKDAGYTSPTSFLMQIIFE